MADAEKVLKVSELVKLTAAPELEHRLAAAVVIGLLGAKSAATKGPAVKDALLNLLDGGIPEERRVAIEALGRLTLRPTLPVLVAHLSDSHSDVREAAERAVAAFGEEAVTELEKARAGAERAEERRSLDAALARVGGKDALGVLLEGIASDAAEGGRLAALGVRQRLKTATAAERKQSLAQVTKFLKRREIQTDAAALAAGLKIVGFHEDKSSIGLLLEFLSVKSPDPRAITDAVRMEAIVGLRFALGKVSDAPEAVSALLDVVGRADERLARAAVDTLRSLEIPAAAHATLVQLAKTSQPERARFAIEKLQSEAGAGAKKALVEVLLAAAIPRAELAARALLGEARASLPLLKAIEKPDAIVDHAPRIVLIAQVLTSIISSFSTAQKKKLVAAAVKAVEDGTPGYESLIKTAREASADDTGGALRDLAARLRKRKKDDKAAVVLGLLEKGGSATAEDRFRRAVLELKKSRKDTKPQSRARDPALKLLAELIEDKVDVGGLLKKERSLDSDDRFYLGWHFIEEGEPLGEEMLDHVIAQAPRTKLARMARNKKKLELES